MSLILALHDALNNQRRQDATVILTIRGGVVVDGSLRAPPEGQGYHSQETVMIGTADGGWQTIAVDELAAVGVRP
jgi:hypothetical protein